MMCFLYTSLLLLKNRFAIRLSRTVCQLSLWRPHPFQVGTMYRTVTITHTIMIHKQMPEHVIN